MRIVIVCHFCVRIHELTLISIPPNSTVVRNSVGDDNLLVAGEPSSHHLSSKYSSYQGHFRRSNFPQPSSGQANWTQTTR